jgi:hypothetical protein
MRQLLDDVIQSSKRHEAEQQQRAELLRSRSVSDACDAAVKVEDENLSDSGTHFQCRY